MIDMRRQQFLAFLGSATVAGSLAARAQPATTPVVGFLSSRSPGESAAHVAAFRQGLSEAGFVEGRNVAVESRWAEGNYERLPPLARELVGLRVNVLVAVGSTPSVREAKAATATIPIVFVGPDPVSFGLVASFNRPGGNITGVNLISTELGAKRLTLLCELVPNARLVGVLLNPDYPDAKPFRRNVEDAAQAVGRRLLFVQVSGEGEFEAAFATLAREGADGLIVENDPFFDSQRLKLVALAARHAVPAIYHIREYAAAGGLMSYGASLLEAYHQAGIYAARILKGTSPAELPIMRPTAFELAINMKTAKVLGLAVPPTLLARADEVIE
jgi:putative tryptophan/tyrosine transport system substrate-binding protein